MTNEDLDKARATEARRLGNYDIVQAAARLAREGWTPPAPVDPDIAEARKIVAQLYDVSWPERANAICAGGQDNNVENVSALAGIKAGRALAKPGLVWVKHDGGKSPIADRDTQVAVIYDDGTLIAGDAHERDWSIVVLYAEITPPAEDVA